MKQCFKRMISCLLVLGVVLVSSGCQDNAPNKIRIAMQYSMYYAPVYIMQEMKLLEEYLPGVEVEWQLINSGSAINEALAANKLDIGFMGMAPAIIGCDKGIYKIATGLCVAPSSLQVNRPEIQSLQDFSATDKIAVPGLGSIQHILLSMAAEKELGDPHALDNNLVSLSHPDGAMALINETDIAGHFTAQPYIYMENKAGYNTILTAKEAFGQDCSIIVSVATEGFALKRADEYAAVVNALEKAMELINQRDPQAMEIIVKNEKITIEEAATLLDWEGTNYTTELFGTMELASYMKKSGFIQSQPEVESDIVWAMPQ